MSHHIYCACQSKDICVFCQCTTKYAPDWVWHFSVQCACFFSPALSQILAISIGINGCSGTLNNLTTMQTCLKEPRHETLKFRMNLLLTWAVGLRGYIITVSCLCGESKGVMKLTSTFVASAIVTKWCRNSFQNTETQRATQFCSYAHSYPQVKICCQRACKKIAAILGFFSPPYCPKTNTHLCDLIRMLTLPSSARSQTKCDSIIKHSESEYCIFVHSTAITSSLLSDRKWLQWY